MLSPCKNDIHQDSFFCVSWCIQNSCIKQKSYTPRIIRLLFVLQIRLFFFCVIQCFFAVHKIISTPSCCRRVSWLGWLGLAGPAGLTWLGAPAWTGWAGWLGGWLIGLAWWLGWLNWLSWLRRLDRAGLDACAMYLHVHVKAYILYIHNMQLEWRLAFAFEYHIG